MVMKLIRSKGTFLEKRAGLRLRGLMEEEDRFRVLSHIIDLYSQTGQL